MELSVKTCDTTACLTSMKLFMFQADLVHLGAKYAPCMHRDEEIYYQIKRERHLESQSGCCIRTDGAGCLQTLEEECSVSDYIYEYL